MSEADLFEISTQLFLKRMETLTYLKYTEEELENMKKARSAEEISCCLKKKQYTLPPKANKKAEDEIKHKKNKKEKNKKVTNKKDKSTKNKDKKKKITAKKSKKSSK